MSGGSQHSEPASDAGRAAERTALAWNRSALALAATGGFVVKAGLDAGSLIGGSIAGGALLIAAASVWAYGVLRYRPARDRRSGLFAPRAAHLLLTAVSVAASLVTLAIVLTG